jgi:hypothetical protein
VSRRRFLGLSAAVCAAAACSSCIRGDEAVVPPGQLDPMMRWAGFEGDVAAYPVYGYEATAIERVHIEPFEAAKRDVSVGLHLRGASYDGRVEIAVSALDDHVPRANHTVGYTTVDGLPARRSINGPNGHIERLTVWGYGGIKGVGQRLRRAASSGPVRARRCGRGPPPTRGRGRSGALVLNRRAA